jgi:hypothetical protein
LRRILISQTTPNILVIESVVDKCPNETSPKRVTKTDWPLFRPP